MFPTCEDLSASAASDPGTFFRYSLAVEKHRKRSRTFLGKKTKDLQFDHDLENKLPEFHHFSKKKVSTIYTDMSPIYFK